MKTLLTERQTQPILYERTIGGTFGGETVKTTAKNAMRDESGKILILVLVLLVVGGLLLGPLLGLMSTGLASGQVYEKKAAELYAADAGVEEAVWRISHNITGDGELFPLNVNERDVEYAIQSSGCGSKRRYIVTSTAYTDGISSTTVTADIYGFSFPDNAITAKKDVDLGNNAFVDGWIQYGQELNTKPNADYDPDKVINEEYANWPSSGKLYAYYYPRYVEGTSFQQYCPEDCLIDAKYQQIVESLYCEAGLDLMSSDNQMKRELTLGGTVYVTDNLYVGDAPEAKAFTLNLNGQTIFCEGDIKITGKTDITGSGSIIAKGSIYFEPNVTSSEGYILLLALEGNIDFMPGGEFTGFLMSADGVVDFKPTGTFYGSVAGDVHVDLESNVSVIHRSAIEANIDFPFEGWANWRIRTYNIS